MSVTSSRSVVVSNHGDVLYSQEFAAADSSAGSGQNQLVSLISGNNTITIPTGAVAVTITPLPLNTVQLIAKGVTGDTGVKLHLTDPSSIGLGVGATLVINAASTATIRLIFS
jgi:hypothetical protein